MLQCRNHNLEIRKDSFVRTKAITQVILSPSVVHQNLIKNFSLGVSEANSRGKTVLQSGLCLRTPNFFCEIVKHWPDRTKANLIQRCRLRKNPVH